LYVGSEQPIKNLEVLFRVFGKLRKEEEYSHFSLKLVGTHFESLPKGVSQIEHAPLEKLQQLYGSASAYVTTSLYESFNYPVVEALSLGCPVVGLRSAIIYEQRAFTHAAADENELFDFMHFAAGGSLPHIDRKALLQRFSWKSYVQGLEKIYNKIS
jgi:glycosyltransferase involved in cell wall biosynthesis